MKKILTAAGLAAFASGALQAAVIHVKPGESVEAAVAAARAAGSVSNEVVFAPGNYHLEKTLELSSQDNGLVLRAEKPGSTVLYGGRRLSGWRKDGDGLWAVDLPDVKTGKLDFRVFVVNGRLAERSVLPGGTNRFENLGQWNVRLLPAMAGYWERRPTIEELSVMPYKREDLPPGFDAANAEVRCYHMWRDSMLRVASNDTERAVLHFTHPAEWPAGACGRRQYEVFNLREGMKKPGQWYLDRTAGKVVYWPLPGEDMAKAVAVAPAVASIVRINGGRGFVTNLTISGISFQAATPPCGGDAGFGARNVTAAIECKRIARCTFEDLDIRNVGGAGISLYEFKSVRLSRVNCIDVGACGMHLRGDVCEMSGCRIIGTGRLYASSCGLALSGRDMHILRNEISDTPYSGVILGGSGHLVEENLVRRAMRVLHDGAAIYGNISHCTLRGNVVRDVVAKGKGFGVAAYYLDEASVDNLLERNVSEGVSRPILGHIVRNMRVTDSVFISEGNMQISFSGSAACTFERNTLVVGGTLNVHYPNVVRWSDNRVFKPKNPSRPEEGYYIGDGTPDNPPERPQAPIVSTAITNGVPPKLDGEMKSGEWPGRRFGVSRDSRRRAIGGAVSTVQAAHDRDAAYILVCVTSFRSAKLSSGHEWGKDDAVQVDLGPVVLRGFVDGTTTCSDPSLASQIASWAGRAKKNRGMGMAQLYAFRVPRAVVSTWADGKGRIPFNVRVFASEYSETRYFEAPDGDAPASFLVIKD